MMSTTLRDSEQGELQIRRLRAAELDPSNFLAPAIVDMVRKPLMVLDRSLRVVAASPSFCRTFEMESTDAEGRLFCELALGLRDVLVLRRLLEDTISGQIVITAYQVELDVPGIGRRRMLLDAHRVLDQKGRDTVLLVGLEDVTSRCEAETLNRELLKQQEILLLEVQHRVANSLQIIASILLLKARTVQSEEARSHLHDVHKRVISIATVQRQLRMSAPGDTVSIGPYLSELCASLASSMISDHRGITVTATSTPTAVKANDAVSYGLIVTELVINALKHGFPDGREGHIAVDFAGDGRDWRLSVSDDGIGRQDEQTEPQHIGLGTSIVEALAKNLNARVELAACSSGTATSVVHAA